MEEGGGGGRGFELSVGKGLEEVGQDGGGPLIPPEETLFFPVTHFRFREHNGSGIIIQTLGLAFLTSCIRFGGAAGEKEKGGWLRRR